MKDLPGIPIREPKDTKNSARILIREPKGMKDLPGISIREPKDTKNPARIPIQECQ